MLHFTIKIKVIVTGRQSKERDAEMNDITVVEREENERKVSLKYKVANDHKTVANGHKWSQMILSSRK